MAIRNYRVQSAEPINNFMTQRMVTPEEQAWLNALKPPVTDSQGKVIPKPMQQLNSAIKQDFLPKDQQDRKAPRANKNGIGDLRVARTSLDVTKEVVAPLLQAGMTVSEVGRKLNIARSTLKMRCIKWGLVSAVPTVPRVHGASSYGDKFDNRSLPDEN